MPLAGVTPPFLLDQRLAPDCAGLFCVERESWRRARRVPSRSAVLHEPGAQATALPSSTLLRPFRCMGSASGSWRRTSVTDRDRRGLEKRRRKS